MESATATVSPPLYDDLGDHHRAIHTSSPEAQKYFDQGLRLVYAFNHDEAQRAFEEAARRDPDCAICLWGVALTLGPNINLPAMPDRAAKAYQAAQKALALAGKTTPVERALIEAVAKRYAATSPAKPEDQAKLDGAYADAMREVARSFPDDADVQTLFAESLMDLRPWDFWTPDGKPQPGTEEILTVLEAVMKKNPRHPGANHYYIHSVEASSHPERGLDAAVRVGGMMKGAGHLVHMPSHIYMRMGKYEEASQSNRDAIVADDRYIAKAKPQGFYAMYTAHNHFFLWAAAMMEGNSAEAMRAARRGVAAMPESMVREMLPMGMDVSTVPVWLTLVRFQKWDAALAEPAPAADLKVPTGLRHWARGMAFAATGKLDDAAREQALLQAIVKDLPDTAATGFQPSKQYLSLSVALLTGELAARHKKTDEAVRALEDAVKIEDGFKYAEPPDWVFPARHLLGAVLLSAGRAAAAAAVYRADLVKNPDNGWALYGLARSLRADKHDDEAARIEAQFTKAWSHADVKIELPRY